MTRGALRDLIHAALPAAALVDVQAGVRAQLVRGGPTGLVFLSRPAFLIGLDETGGFRGPKAWEACVHAFMRALRTASRITYHVDAACDSGASETP